MSEYGDRLVDGLTRRPYRTLAGVGIQVVGVVILLALIVGLGGLALGWWNAGKRIAGPANISEQYRAVIEDWQSLEATAANACQAKGTPRSERDPTLIEGPDFAYAAQYRRISVDYNRRQANFFEAEKVGPKGYPRVAPVLAQMEKRVC